MVFQLYWQLLSWCFCRKFFKLLVHNNKTENLGEKNYRVSHKRHIGTTVHFFVGASVQVQLHPVFATPFTCAYFLGYPVHLVSRENPVIFLPRRVFVFILHSQLLFNLILSERIKSDRGQFSPKVVYRNCLFAINFCLSQFKHIAT